MKKFLLLMLFCTIGFAYSSKASSIYTVDDATIETTLSMATPVTLQLSDAASMFMDPMAISAAKSDKKFWVALIWCYFLGGVGAHRVYLGAKGAMIFYYIITGCGIFGIVPTIDFIMLIVDNKDISKYVGSNRYFMWAGGK
jgi:TM2 domain-containing membrane protein YozV